MVAGYTVRMDAMALPLDFDTPAAPEPAGDDLSRTQAQLVAQIAEHEDALLSLRERLGRNAAARVLDEGWTWDRAQAEAHVARTTMSRIVRRERSRRRSA